MVWGPWLAGVVGGGEEGGEGVGRRKVKIWKRGRGEPFKVREGSGGIGEGFTNWGKGRSWRSKGEKGGFVYG